MHFPEWNELYLLKWFGVSRFDHRGEFLIFQNCWNWSSLCIVWKKEAFIHHWYLQSCRHRLPGLSQRAPTWLCKSNSSSMWGSVTDCRSGRAGPSVWKSQSCRQGLNILYTLLWAANQRWNMRSQILAGLNNLILVMKDGPLLPLNILSDDSSYICLDGCKWSSEVFPLRGISNTGVLTGLRAAQ